MLPFPKEFDPNLTFRRSADLRAHGEQQARIQTFSSRRIYAENEEALSSAVSTRTRESGCRLRTNAISRMQDLSRRGASFGEGWIPHDEGA